MGHNPYKLKVREKARDLAIQVHRICDRHRELMGSKSPTLRTQMTRAVDSIALNIAEGSGKSDRAFASRLEIAIGECNELEMQLDLAIHALPATCAPLIELVIEVRKMSIGLRKRLRGNSASCDAQRDALE